VTGSIKGYGKNIYNHCHISLYHTEIVDYTNTIRNTSFVTQWPCRDHTLWKHKVSSTLHL